MRHPKFLCLTDGLPSWSHSEPHAVGRRPVQQFVVPAEISRAGVSHLYTEPLPLTMMFAQHGHSDCLCAPPPSELYNIMANAYTMGAEETRTPYFGLYDYILSRKTMLWVRRRSASELCAGAFPLHTLHAPHGR